MNLDKLASFTKPKLKQILIRCSNLNDLGKNSGTYISIWMYAKLYQQGNFIGTTRHMEIAWNKFKSIHK